MNGLWVKFITKKSVWGSPQTLVIKKVIYKSNRILKINGMLALEIGNEQIKKVSKILINNNFRIVHVIKDYKNNVRCVLALNKWITIEEETLDRDHKKVILEEEAGH